MISYSPDKIMISINRYYIDIYPIYEEEKKHEAQKKKYPDHEIISNSPLSGFRLTHSYSGWSLIDPRGFTYQIKDSDIAYIVSNCVLDNGEIVSKCRYYWNGRKMSIISEFDPRFEKINQSKEQREFAVKDLEKGDTFALNGSSNRYVYYGERYALNASIGSFMKNNSIFPILKDNNGYSGSTFYGAYLNKYIVDTTTGKVFELDNKKVYDVEKSKIDTSVYDNKFSSMNTKGFKVSKTEVDIEDDAEFREVLNKIYSITPGPSYWSTHIINGQYILFKTSDITFIGNFKRNGYPSRIGGGSVEFRIVPNDIDKKIEKLLSRTENNNTKKLNVSLFEKLLKTEFDKSKDVKSDVTFNTKSRNPKEIRITSQLKIVDFVITSK